MHRARFAAALALALPAFAALASACSSTSSSSPSGDAPGAAAPVPLTFHDAIEPILQERCQRCHHDGGIAPFSLVTYADWKAVAGVAKQDIVARKMPPWGAYDEEGCKVQHSFRDDLRMTDDEIATVVKWFEADQPEGDPSHAPPPRSFPPSGLEGKTHTFTAPAPYEVLGGGKDDIECFPIDPGFTEDTWVAATNVLPGDPRVVHHVIVYVDPNGEGAAKANGATHYPCFGGPLTSNPSLLLAWAPGVPPTSYGEDAGIKVPKGSHLVLQVHYHPTTVTAADQTAFELKVLPFKPSFVSQILFIGNADSGKGLLHLVPGPDDPPDGPVFLVPANKKGHTETMEITIPEQVKGVTPPTMNIFGVGSHMHWAGVDLSVQVHRKAPTDGQPADECLLATPKYDFNWQRGYAYDEPYDELPTVGAGDTVRVTCTYDNTMDNPNIAKAVGEQQLPGPVDIHLGETTLDEMCLGVVATIRRATAID